MPHLQNTFNYRFRKKKFTLKEIETWAQSYSSMGITQFQYNECGAWQNTVAQFLWLPKQGFLQIKSEYSYFTLYFLWPCRTKSLQIGQKFHPATDWNHTDSGSVWAVRMIRCRLLRWTVPAEREQMFLWETWMRLWCHPRMDLNGCHGDVDLAIDFKTQIDMHTHKKNCFLSLIPKTVLHSRQKFHLSLHYSRLHFKAKSRICSHLLFLINSHPMINQTSGKLIIILICNP